MRKFIVIAAKTVLALLSLGGLGLLVLALYVVWHVEYEIGIPDVAHIAATSTEGSVCRAGKQDSYTPLAEIPAQLQSAIIALEEPEFYQRPSLNPYLESAFAAISNRSPRPSGITLGVTRCLMGRSANCCRGLDWHVGNAYLVSHVARAFTRDRILEIYLNESYLGRGAFGVTAGAEAYFGKALANLDIDQIAFLVTRARQPYPSRSFDTVSRDYTIDRMQAAGLISETQAAAAKSRPLFLEEMPGTQAQPINQ